MVQEWCCTEQQVAEETEERWLTRLDGDRRDDVTHTALSLILISTVGMGVGG